MEEGGVTVEGWGEEEEEVSQQVQGPTGETSSQEQDRCGHATAWDTWARQDTMKEKEEQQHGEEPATS